MGSPAVLFRRVGSFQTELKGSSLCLEEVVIVTKEVTMSQTPPWLYGWEDLSCELNTHLLKQEKNEEEEEEYLSILHEAQRESCEPGSRLTSPPPLSPDTEELAVCERDVSLDDYLWDWSSRINVSPPPEWRLERSKSKYCSSSSLCDSRKPSQDNSPGKDVGDQRYFSLLFSNIISLIIGTGLGVWLYKRNYSNVFKHSNIFV